MKHFHHSNFQTFRFCSSSNTTCVIYVTPTHPTESCKFILNEPTNKAVTRLRLWLRNSEGCDNLPELSDTVSKFPNLYILVLGFMELKNIERARLTPFRKIKNLYLFRNEISQLKFDTFDDLRNLKVLHLQYNMIYDLHENLFNELRNLEELALNNNQLEIIPQGVFRSNGKLQRIYLQNNQIRRIDFQFDSLPRLESLNLEANVCINEKFNFKKIYDQSLLESVRYC